MSSSDGLSSSTREHDARRRPVNTGLSATVNEVLKGWLSVKVLFLGEPVEGLHVKFYGASGPLDDGGKTNAQGIYAHAANGHATEVEVGLYRCEIERQHEPLVTTVEQLPLVTTVEHPTRPFVVVLPVGRPYFDSYRDPAERPPAPLPDAGPLPAPHTGWLAVSVLFVGEPVEGLHVQFHDAGAVVAQGRTDAHGVFRHTVPVESGLYECRIEAGQPGQQPAVQVSTVEHPDRPFVLALPLGRPVHEPS